MLKKCFVYVCLLAVMSITSVSAVNFSCQSTVTPVEAKFTADCNLKTLRTKAKYTGSSDAYTYITRIVDGGTTLASCGVHAGKKNNECTYSSAYYYYSTPHTHNYTRYNN